MNRIQQVPAEGESYKYTRQDLQDEISRLDQKVRSYTQLGLIVEADTIAYVISRHSQALVTGLLTYEDPNTSKQYWLGRGRLLGGVGEEMHEDADRFAASGRALYGEGKLAEALELFQRCVVIEERLAPNSLDVALSYTNIGVVY